MPFSILWCEGRDSNPHAFRRQILSLVRLPIPSFFFSSRRRHTRLTCDWSSDCALPISGYVCVEQGVESEGRIVPSALVESGCRIAEGARIGGRAVLEHGVSVGANTTIE